jgi:hypothetical protein
MARGSGPRTNAFAPGNVEMCAGAANDGLDPSRTVQSPRLSQQGASWGGDADAAASQLVRPPLGLPGGGGLIAAMAVSVPERRRARLSMSGQPLAGRSQLRSRRASRLRSHKERACENLLAEEPASASNSLRRRSRSGGEECA